MEPQIQYVKTSDGVNIAYYTIGQGPPLLFLTMPISHLEAEWQIDSLRMVLTATAQQSTVIRLDPRGFGLSDRDPDDFALDSLVLDIEAVVDRLGLDQLRIYAYALHAIPALVYTARHPDQVTHLVQTPPAASFEDIEDERFLRIGQMAHIDWELASETAIRAANPEFQDQLVRDFGSLLRASIEATSAQRLMEDTRRWDGDAEAMSLTTPTLLIHERKNRASNMATTRRVAGLIKNSRVAFIDNSLETSLLAQRFFDGDDSSSEREAKPAVKSPVAGGFATILFTDMESSTALTQQLGDAAAQKVRRAHNDIVRSALAAHGGSEIKHTGDGIMSAFAAASPALECAMSIQRHVAAHKEEHPGFPLGVYIGLNAGEPIAEEGDLYGTSVDLAARICDHAEPGQILAADVVRQLVAGKDFLFADLGETELRGFEDPVKLWELRWRDEESP